MNAIHSVIGGYLWSVRVWTYGRPQKEKNGLSVFFTMTQNLGLISTLFLYFLKEERN